MDPHSAHSEIAKKLSRYRDGLEKAGHDLGPRDIPTARLVAVAETDAQAAAIAERGAKWTAGYIPKQALASFRSDDQIPDHVDHYMDDVIIHGSPERVIDILRRLEEEIPLNYLLLSPLSDKSFELFTERVLPHFV